MLFIVNYEKEVCSNNWKTYTHYSFGESKEEAILHVKNHFLCNTESRTRNFSASAVKDYDHLGDYKLYRVTYSNWKCDFSGTYSEEVVAIGRCSEEAICYAKALAQSDSVDFDANIITDVCGHKVLIA